MKILIAPDSYKESLEANDVANIIKKSFQTVFLDANIQTIPMADGGEGTVKALVQACHGERVNVNVNDPIGREITAYYGLIHKGKTAVIEMATASGLELLKEDEKNPLQTSTFGFGELINDALKRGVKKLILGLGGSATNDAGVGMLQALGVKFYDKNNNEVPQGAEFISNIQTIDDSILKEKFKNIKIEVACDVINPLCGQNGASHIFGKQKGANEQMIQLLDNNLINFATLCEAHFNKETQHIEGSGAAGGLGFGLVTFLDAKLQSGIKLVMDAVDLETHIKEVDLVITGEGKMDSQTLQGKTPYGVAKLAKKHDKTVIAIAGCLDEGYEILLENGFDAIFDCTPISMDFETVKKNAARNLELTALNVAKLLKIKLN